MQTIAQVVIWIVKWYQTSLLKEYIDVMNLKYTVMQKINNKLSVLSFLFLFIFAGFLLLTIQITKASNQNLTDDRRQTQVSKDDLKGSRILVYTKNGEGYVHENISNSVEAIKELGREYEFTVDVSEDPADFTIDNLQKYDALVFSNTNNDIFETPEQHEALQNYIRSGGGFVGIHSASGSERDWPWFWSLLGGKFFRHPPFQEFTTKVADKTHPSTSFLPESWVREDECYYLKQLNPNINVLLYADLTTVEDKEQDKYPGEVFGDKFPLAWYHEFEGGRSWYTALGHSVEAYDNPVFMKHILGGIQWAVSGNSGSN